MEMSRLLIPFPIWNSLSLFGLSLQLSILNLASCVCCVAILFLNFTEHLDCALGDIHRNTTLVTRVVFWMLNVFKMCKITSIGGLVPLQSSPITKYNFATTYNSHNFSLFF